MSTPDVTIYFDHQRGLQSPVMPDLFGHGHFDDKPPLERYTNSFVFYASITNQLRQLVVENCQHRCDVDPPMHGRVLTRFAFERSLSCSFASFHETFLQLLRYRWGMWRIEPLSCCVNCMMKFIGTIAFPVNRAPVSIVSLIAASGRFDFDYDNGVEYLRRTGYGGGALKVPLLRYTAAPARTPAHTQAFEEALSRPMVERAAFELARPRMAEISIALCDLNLPVLLVVLIIEEACKLAATRFRRGHSWELAATIKHWFDKDRQPKKRRTGQ